jgi:hypothetical protein
MSPRSALLSKSGYLRLSADLLPGVQKGKHISFFLTSFPATRRIELKPAHNGATGPWTKRKALFSNRSSKSPLVSIKVALRFIGMRLPTHSVEYKVKKKKDGTLVVQF